MTGKKKILRRARIAYEKGYRVTANGLVVGLRTKSRKLNIDNRGYLRFSIRYQGEHLGVSVHRLAAYQKFGEALFDDGIVTRHLDGNKTSNNLNNITIGTHSDNMMDIPIGTRTMLATKAGRANSRLTINDVREIRRLREEKRLTYIQIMSIYPIAKSTLSYICNYKTWNF